MAESTRPSPDVIKTPESKEVLSYRGDKVVGQRVLLEVSKKVSGSTTEFVDPNTTITTDDVKDEKAFGIVSRDNIFDNLAQSDNTVVDQASNRQRMKEAKIERSRLEQEFQVRAREFHHVLTGRYEGNDSGQQPLQYSPDWNEFFSNYLKVTTGKTQQEVKSEHLYDLLRHQYFTGDNAESQTKAFERHILEMYTTTQSVEDAKNSKTQMTKTVVDRERLVKDLDKVQHIATLFGSEGINEIIAHLLDERTDAFVNTDSYITVASQEQPLNGEMKLLANDIRDIRGVKDAQGRPRLSDAQKLTKLSGKEFIPQTKQKQQPKQGETPKPDTPPINTKQVERKFNLDEQWQLLKDKIGPRWDHVQKMRDEIQKSPLLLDKNLPVYYPGSLDDIAQPLAVSDASQFIFVDYLYKGGQDLPATQKLLTDRIQEIGGNISSIKTKGELHQGGKMIIHFNWGGRERTIVCYGEDATKFKPAELNEGAVLTFINRPTPFGQGEDAPGEIWTPENRAKLSQQVPIGGYVNWKVASYNLPPELIGYTKVLDKPQSSEGFDIWPLHQKIFEEPELESLLQFDSQLEWIKSARQYGNGGIDTDTYDYYEMQLKQARKIFDELSPAHQQQLVDILKSVLVPDTLPPDEMEKMKQYGGKLGLKNEQNLQAYIQELKNRTYKLFPELIGSHSNTVTFTEQEIRDMVNDSPLLEDQIKILEEGDIEDEIKILAEEFGTDPTALQTTRSVVESISVESNLRHYREFIQNIRNKIATEGHDASIKQGNRNYELPKTINKYGYDAVANVSIDKNTNYFDTVDFIQFMNDRYGVPLAIYGGESMTRGHARLLLKVNNIGTENNVPYIDVLVYDPMKSGDQIMKVERIQSVVRDDPAALNLDPRNPGNWQRIFNIAANPSFVEMYNLDKADFTIASDPILNRDHRLGRLKSERYQIADAENCVAFASIVGLSRVAARYSADDPNIPPPLQFLFNQGLTNFAQDWGINMATQKDFALFEQAMNLKNSS